MICGKLIMLAVLAMVLILSSQEGELEYNSDLIDQSKTYYYTYSGVKIIVAWKD